MFLYLGYRHVWYGCCMCATVFSFHFFRRICVLSSLGAGRRQKEAATVGEGGGKLEGVVIGIRFQEKVGE